MEDGQKFNHYRNNKLLGTVSCIRGSDDKGRYFYYVSDNPVRVGDIFSTDSQIQYFVSDLDEVPDFDDETKLVAYYLTETEKKEKESVQPNVSFQIENVHSSVVGSGNHTTFNINQGLDNILSEINRRDPVDREQLNEMVNELRTLIENDTPVSQGTLSKFSDLLTKHAWLTGPLGQALVSWAFRQ
ncbi:hypothetical protein [Bacillus haynesii]|uniref:hypothetical protein n=1 Tax=Bacillus haynesii TaxID=1925021 RepID=UPI002280E08F|nr:hypothetical protein [Bacillus haynesii]MCY7835249.1 hypothetical protein [Bacillus haynesii]MCY8667436.1 hypothetical protein [Bacillus haynesii]